MTGSFCSACADNNCYTLYRLDRIPAFQNKLFRSKEQASSSVVARVDFKACPKCDFVFNGCFDNSLMEYDADYQNSQEHSPSFQSHLDDIARKIETLVTKEDKIIEIGCGKGYFLEHLRARGFDVTGFDPAYEGEKDYIVKSYFNHETALSVVPKAVVMRHTLEHIENPVAFLRGLRGILPRETMVFIEVPRFEWIVENRAFWDIFHEHCNYFTERFFNALFSNKAIITPVFGGQYMLVAAHLQDMVEMAVASPQPPTYKNVFSEELRQYQALLSQCKNNYVWGAGAKGIAFVNTLDMKGEHVSAIVDINKKKQGYFVALTGHACVAPESIDWNALTEKDCLWIMNGLYQKEILASLPPLKCKVEVMGEKYDFHHQEKTA